MEEEFLQKVAAGFSSLAKQSDWITVEASSNACKVSNNIEKEITNFFNG